MKIAFIGGGSFQWTTKLVTDMALNATLAGELVLHDINPGALDLLTRASRRVIADLGGRLQVTSTLRRADALRGADYVILCVAIGGLEAARNDLEIPERYGIKQSVGDTVGPGGLARGLRHIPFAVQVAREMEEACPRAWLLNLTNPMTTICRAITRETSVRTIGLCHEMDLFRRHRLAPLFGVDPEEDVLLEVAGINHLPGIVRFRLGGQDGPALLRDWLSDHDRFHFIHDHAPEPEREVFLDRWAVKLTLFDQVGVLFGAGDRHLAEFVPWVLTECNEWGARYGVLLTTTDHHRVVNLVKRREWVERFVAGAPATLQHSDEALARVIAALAGGPPGRFVVNLPNTGQVDNLPRHAVVECMADVDALGAHPVAAGPLPHGALALTAPHVSRQELIVEAALTGRRDPARAAMATDPLVRDPLGADAMLDELCRANSAFLGSEFIDGPAGRG